jgi:hypothetical protein
MTPHHIHCLYLRFAHCFRDFWPCVLPIYILFLSKDLASVYCSLYTSTPPLLPSRTCAVASYTMINTSFVCLTVEPMGYSTTTLSYPLHLTVERSVQWRGRVGYTYYSDYSKIHFNYYRSVQRTVQQGKYTRGSFWISKVHHFLDAAIGDMAM